VHRSHKSGSHLGSGAGLADSAKLRNADAANLGRSLLQKYAERFDYPNGHMCVIRPNG